MKVLPAGWKRTVRRRWRARSGPCVAVLLYHRVAEVKRDPWEMCVAPDRFREHLEVLRTKRWPVVPLADLPGGLSAKNCPRRAVTITFDDGYADNLHIAAPLLDRFDTPATVAVTTGAVDARREFWWDELERLLLEPHALPGRLELEVGDREHSWKVEEADLTPIDDTSWRTWEPPPTTRHALYNELWCHLYPAPAHEKTRVLIELARWAGQSAGVRPSHRVLSSSELRTLAGTGLIEVAAHTVGHSALSSLPTLAQKREIFDSKSQLEAWLDAPVSSFSYPHGAYNQSTLDLVREAGFRRACSTSTGVVRPDAAALTLPRLDVKNWDGDAFARHLDSVMSM